MIPDKAELAYDGDIFKVYTWEQELFDGSTKIFETVKRKPTVQLIVATRDKLLLLDEEAATGEQYISLPGGMVEWGEDPEEAAKRELLEETGMEAGSMELYLVQEHKGKIIWPTYYFICKDAEQVTEPSPDPGERIKVIEKDFNDFTTEVLKDSFRNRQFSEHIRLLRAEGNIEELRSRIWNNS